MKDAKILILGVTFKENCPDIRNTKVVDIYHTLREYTENITVCDPWANAEAVMREYSVAVQKEIPSEQFDAIILAVPHKLFLDIDIQSLKKSNAVVYDVKGFLDRNLVDMRL